MTATKRGGARQGAGRPKGRVSRATPSQKATLSELARKHTATALQVLVDVAKKGESESARVAAANAILDRGYGKPRQALEHSGPNGGPIPTVDLTNVSADDLDRLEALFGPLAGAAGDDSEADQGGEGAEGEGS